MTMMMVVMVSIHWFVGLFFIPLIELLGILKNSDIFGLEFVKICNICKAE